MKNAAPSGPAGGERESGKTGHQKMFRIGISMMIQGTRNLIRAPDHAARSKLSAHVPEIPRSLLIKHVGGQGSTFIPTT